MNLLALSTLIALFLAGFVLGLLTARRLRRPEPLAARELEARQEASVLHRQQQHLEELVEERTRELDRQVVQRVAAEAERAHLEAQLLQAQKMEALGRLAGGVAHDFNNLLTAILGYADIARASLAPDDELAEDLAEIHAAADRATSLTRQLLAFSRKQVAYPRSVDLVDAIQRAHRMLGRLIGEDVRLELLLPEGPLVVRVDPTQLDQVVFNLAVNARDAMPDGGELSLAVYQEEDSAVLRVSDDGAGMDEDTRRRVFEPFFTTKPEGEGTGLGLSTVYGVVNQAGGSITVESTLDVGTTFVVESPLTKAEASPIPAAERASVLHLVEDPDDDPRAS